MARLTASGTTPPTFNLSSPRSRPAPVTAAAAESAGRPQVSVIPVSPRRAVPHAAVQPPRVRPAAVTAAVTATTPAVARPAAAAPAPRPRAAARPAEPPLPAVRPSRPQTVAPAAGSRSRPAAAAVQAPAPRAVVRPAVAGPPEARRPVGTAAVPGWTPTPPFPPPAGRDGVLTLGGL